MSYSKANNMNPAQYRRYMASATWATRKQRYFERYRRQCVACGTSAGQIDLHHITYVRAPGNESDKDMVPLCAWCHAEVHRIERTGARGLRQATIAVTGGQRPWRLDQRAKVSPKAKKRKTHKSDRYKPLVAGILQPRPDGPPSADVFVSAGKGYVPRKRKKSSERRT